MPCHANHQTTVVTPVGWPPRLAVNHESVQVFLERLDIELCKLGTVVKVSPKRVGLLVMLVQDV
jgi:hypothetical protein